MLTNFLESFFFFSFRTFESLKKFKKTYEREKNDGKDVQHERKQVVESLKIFP